MKKIYIIFGIALVGIVYIYKGRINAAQPPVSTTHANANLTTKTLITTITASATAPTLTLTTTTTILAPKPPLSFFGALVDMYGNILNSTSVETNRTITKATNFAVVQDIGATLADIETQKEALKKLFPAIAGARDEAQNLLRLGSAQILEKRELELAEINDLVDSITIDNSAIQQKVNNVKSAMKALNEAIPDKTIELIQQRGKTLYNSLTEEEKSNLRIAQQKLLDADYKQETAILQASTEERMKYNAIMGTLLNDIIKVNTAINTFSDNETAVNLLNKLNQTRRRIQWKIYFMRNPNQIGSITKGNIVNLLLDHNEFTLSSVLNDIPQII